MKNLFFAIVILSAGLLNAQSFNGKGDSKFQVGANLQKNASGINVAYDYGIGDNISIGISSTYLLGVKDELNADFGDRFDLKARFNANLGNVLKIDQNFDFYPGLSLGLKNFGGHLGLKYFFTSGFGVYSEFGFPLAKYKSDELTSAELLHNQSYFNIGASFNLE
jgi:hypothetical protein